MALMHNPPFPRRYSPRWRRGFFVLRNWALPRIIGTERPVIALQICRALPLLGAASRVLGRPPVSLPGPSLCAVCQGGLS